MLIQETIAVAAAVAAAAIYLVRITLLKSRRRLAEETPCGGCKCARAVQLNRRSVPHHGAVKPG